MQVRRGADRAEIYSLAFSSTVQWLAVLPAMGTVHVFGLKANLANLGSDKAHVASDANRAVSSPALSLSFMKGKFACHTLLVYLRVILHLMYC